MSLTPQQAIPGILVVVSSRKSPFFGVLGVIESFDPKTKRAYVVFEETATVGGKDYNGGEFPIRNLDYPD